ncbi:hypothetical protein G6F55_014570 [Rhizopus delemar]|nr:hypothetical protein G6F55_014570 [Rhizopus delemar]
MQLIAFQRLQRGIERGGFHDHRVAWGRDCGKAQVQRVQRAVGDDDVVHWHRHAGGQVAQRERPAQRRIAGAEVIDRAPRIQPLYGGRHELGQAAVG